MTEQIVELRIETLNDGRKAVIADVSGAGRVFFGYIGDNIHLPIGGADRVASRLVQ